MKLSKTSVLQIVITVVGALAGITGAVLDNSVEDRRIDEKVQKALSDK